MLCSRTIRQHAEGNHSNVPVLCISTQGSKCPGKRFQAHALFIHNNYLLNYKRWQQSVLIHTAITTLNKDQPCNFTAQEYSWNLTPSQALKKNAVNSEKNRAGYACPSPGTFPASWLLPVVESAENFWSWSAAVRELWVKIAEIYKLPSICDAWWTFFCFSFC